MKPCEYIQNLIAEREPTDEFKYMLLDRMKQDCNYYLYGCGRCAKYVWSNDPGEHIANMNALWNSFPDDAKPEWLTMEKIEEYEKDMLA